MCSTLNEKREEYIDSEINYSGQTVIIVGVHMMGFNNIY